ncbi:MAG: acetyl-CoA carboxylase biotin carboxyl carrier protein [bacterium]|nr:acetyl-CoA carboxylase biotin carboxyl carrier protein [bacterium]
MKIETDYIEKIVEIITKNGLTEISLEDGEQAITIRKDATLCVPVAQTTTPSMTVSAIEEAITEPDPSKGKAIVSPMVGTYYSSTSPENPPFVEVGSNISEGDVVCVIEAMKLMNEIKSEYTGKITQICVQNGDPIEYGQVLMYVE